MCVCVCTYALIGDSECVRVCVCSCLCAPLYTAVNSWYTVFHKGVFSNPEEDRDGFDSFTEALQVWSSYCCNGTQIGDFDDGGEMVEEEEERRTKKRRCGWRGDAPDIPARRSRCETRDEEFPSRGEVW